MKFYKYLAISKYIRICICIWFMMMLQLISTLNETENRSVNKFAAIEKTNVHNIWRENNKKKLQKQYLLNQISF